MSPAVSSDEISPSLAGIINAIDLDVLARRGQTSPDGMMTIAFTDVEESTAMLERLGEERWFELMRLHNGLIRSCVSRHGGAVAGSRGDGFLITFASASFALSCAVALQRTFASFNERHPGQQLRVRVGLHTGTILQAEDELLGRTVVLAARITGQAQGGEILVSADCVEYTKRVGLWRYGEPGLLQMKGFSGVHSVYRLDWAGKSEG